ncbi:Beta-1,3-glucan-binding protein [Orchesella cincta]|uniref:Beta-1,3-glucan-binding protein n=1 Tax=Orchesella cincta TaxID=48709 RepID=A0A1D2NLE1_ORCCI|nr:Beta-1,3-glucan-binding protein [Orchesella cincta]
MSKFFALITQQPTVSLLTIAVPVLLLLISQVDAQQSRRVRERSWSSTVSMVQRRHQPGELIFAEEFHTLDPNIWEHEITMAGKTNGEFQMYDDDPINSYVRNGILYIKPTTTATKFGEKFLEDGTVDFGTRCTDATGVGCQMRAKRGSGGDIISPIVSARMNTRSVFGFRYGHMEIRAKLPVGDWIWPAIWLMPQANRYGMWPQSGEIDIMESRGNRVLVTPAGEDIGCNQFGSTLHFGINRTTDMWRLAHFKRNDPAGFHSKFHNYGLIWTPDQFIFTLDDEIMGTITPPPGGFWEMGNFTGPKLWDNNKMSPFNQPFYIILNVAVGGDSGYFPENTKPPKPWKNGSPTAREDFWSSRSEWLPTWDAENSALQLDYIRIWAL